MGAGCGRRRAPDSTVNAFVTGVMRVKGVEGGKPYTRRDRFVDAWLLQKGTGCVLGRMPRPFYTDRPVLIGQD